MYGKLGLGVVLMLLPGIALAQKQQTEREERNRQQEADRVRVLAKMVSFAMGMQNIVPAALTVDVEAEDYLAVTVTNGRGEQMVLEFEANERGGGLRPILPEGTEGKVFGRQFFGLFDTMLTYHASKLEGNPPTKEELLPFDAAAAQQLHDDVSVFVVDEELVLIRLWNRGRLLGTYFAVDMDAALERFEVEQAQAIESGEAIGGVAATPTPKDMVCGKLFNECIAAGWDIPHAVACLLWLLFCQ